MNGLLEVAYEYLAGINEKLLSPEYSTWTKPAPGLGLSPAPTHSGSVPGTGRSDSSDAPGHLDSILKKFNPYLLRLATERKMSLPELLTLWNKAQEQVGECDSATYQFIRTTIVFRDLLEMLGKRKEKVKKAVGRVAKGESVDVLVGELLA